MSDDDFMDIGEESEVDTSDQNRITNKRNKDGKFVRGKDVDGWSLKVFRILKVSSLHLFSKS